MNIVILSACDIPVASYLTREILSEWRVSGIIRPVWKMTKRSFLSRIRRISVSKIADLFRQIYYGWYYNRMTSQIQRLLFGTTNSTTLPNCYTVSASSINDEENINYLRSLNPDILVVCMAPILKPEIFLIPRIATVNIHFGIAPNYRGEHTLFWPLYLRDYDNIGITLHHINRGIDSGYILAHGYPSLERSDTEATLYAKCARIAVTLLTEFLNAAQYGNVQGHPQSVKGQLFKRRDRKVWRDLRYYIYRYFLNYVPPHRSEQISKYF